MKRGKLEWQIFYKLKHFPCPYSHPRSDGQQAGLTSSLWISVNVFPHKGRDPSSQLLFQNYLGKYYGNLNLHSTPSKRQILLSVFTGPQPYLFFHAISQNGYIFIEVTCPWARVCSWDSFPVICFTWLQGM